VNFTEADPGIHVCVKNNVIV